MLFVSWTSHSRPRDLSQRLGAEYVVPGARFELGPWPIRYAVQAAITFMLILRVRPKAVIFTNPPFIAGAVCVAACRLVGAQCWCDCHSGAFNNPRWSRFSALNRTVLRACTGVIFHTLRIADERRHEVRRSVVLGIYAMNDRTRPVSSRPDRTSDRPLVVASCSYGFDEPIDILFAAIEGLPELGAALTGNPPADLLERAPQNARFTGFLSDEDYHQLLDDADLVVCLTTREATMQNGLIEGLEHGRPVITSHTMALAEWAEDIPGVITARNESEALSSAIQTVLSDLPGWTRAAAQGREAAERRSEEELHRLLTAIDGESSKAPKE